MVFSSSGAGETSYETFVELAWLNFLFGVGLVQFFVGAALLGSPVGLYFVELVWLTSFLINVGLACDGHRRSCVVLPIFGAKCAL